MKEMIIRSMLKESKQECGILEHTEKNFESKMYAKMSTGVQRLTEPMQESACIAMANLCMRRLFDWRCKYGLH